eukprot:3782840-Pyramimonas_sp.AAC.1
MSMRTAADLLQFSHTTTGGMIWPCSQSMAIYQEIKSWTCEDLDGVRHARRSHRLFARTRARALQPPYGLVSKGMG